MNAQTARHTQTPWRLSEESPRVIQRDFTMIGDTSGELIASASGYPNSAYFPSDEEAIANAAFIVTACNAHAELVAENARMNNLLAVEQQTAAGMLETAATRRQEIFELVAALQYIVVRASCAPNDDTEIAGQEFMHIMNHARTALAKVSP